MSKPNKNDGQVVGCVPKLRFDGFEGDWKNRKLGEVAKFFKGKGLPKSELDDLGSEPCIHYGQLFTEYSEVINSIISRTKPRKDCFLSVKNDVLMPTSDVTPRGLAKASAIEFDDVILGGDILIIRTDQEQIYGAFLSRFIRNREQEILKFVSGSTVFHLYSSSLEKFRVFLPSLHEQQKIASCLYSLDELISAESQKLASLKEHKKGLMQKLFPQEGQTVPELRFEGFEGDWEEYTLIQVAKFRRGSFPQPYGLPEWYDDIHGIPFIQVYDVDDNFSLKPKTKNKISKLASKQSVFIAAGTLIVTIQGSIGRVAITQYDAYIDRTLLIFERFLQPIEKRFFAYVIHNLFEIKKEKAAGGTIKTITKEELSAFKITLPTLTEQQKIASCLSSLDDLITAQADYIHSLKQHKKGLMQQLFPSMDETN